MGEALGAPVGGSVGTTGAPVGGMLGTTGAVVMGTSAGRIVGVLEESIVDDDNENLRNNVRIIDKRQSTKVHCSLTISNKQHERSKYTYGYLHLRHLQL